MMEFVRKYSKELLITTALLVLFLSAGYFSQMYSDALSELLEGRKIVAMMIYITGATIATVIAPLSFLPALPIAVTLWGSFAAALLSIFAWSIGSAINFLLARRYGRPLVSRFVGQEKMDHFSKLIPQERIFIAVVFLRVALPVDLLSYVLGLIGVIRFVPYMLATVIGITPFAFLLSYTAGIDVRYQIGAFLIGSLFVLLSFPHLRQLYMNYFTKKIDETKKTHES